MYKKQETLSDAERVRLEEVTFCNFISHLFSVNSNPTKAYAFIEVVCTLGKCNLIVINGVVSICMTQDRRYVPTTHEHVYLLSKSTMSVRKITPYLGISQRDYYGYLEKEPPDIQPKFSPVQYIEMIKFIDCLHNLLPERIM